jgi:hypothetical protein
LEALAYHEAGHAVMAVLLDIPIEKVVIGPRCTDPEFNGRVIIDVSACPSVLPGFMAALLNVASEPAEKMAPSYNKFASIHRVHRHLKPFNTGVRNDLIHGFHAVMPAYALMGYAEGAAKKLFKAQYRVVAAALIEAKSMAVHRLARRLQRELELSGSQVVAVVQRAGPLRFSEQGRRFNAAIARLRSGMASPLEALSMLRNCN